jgi:hypothetical protein
MVSRPTFKSAVVGPLSAAEAAATQDTRIKVPTGRQACHVGEYQRLGSFFFKLLDLLSTTNLPQWVMKNNECLQIFNKH